VTDKMVVLSNAIPSREDAYNRWYDEVHAADVMTRVRGYTAVSRYRAAERQLASPLLWRYIAIWDVDADVGLVAAMDSVRELRAMKRSGGFDPEDTLYLPNSAMKASASTWFRQIERVDGTIGPDAADDHLLIVFGNSVAATEEQFDDWYAEHGRDALHKLNAFKCTERYTVADDQLEEPKYRHMLIYRIANDELANAQDAILSLLAKRAVPGAAWWFSPQSQIWVEQLSGGRGH